MTIGTHTSKLEIESLLEAPPDNCFALVRDPRLHTDTHTFVEGEFGLGQRVRFESKVFGMKQVLIVEVTEFEQNRLITDTMISGAFREFRHIHEFSPKDGGTLMRDTLEWTSPFGILGKVADLLFVRRRLRNVVERRNQMLGLIARPGSLDKHL